ncbi:MAG TPA: hypothetical protein VIW69_20500 [Candidatus Elarobacter sp.]
MQQILSLIAAATTLATTNAGTPGTSGVAVSSPIAVSSCAVANLYDPALLVVFGSPITVRSLSLSFRNTDDVTATQVAFDVVHAGAHTTVIDRGRFSKGALIEHQFDNDFAGAYTREPDTCAVASITFADGRRWTAVVDNRMTASTNTR